MPKKIVVIDDDKALLEGARRALSKVGYATVTLENPGDFATLEGDPPNLIIIDVMIGEALGDDFCERLRFDKRVAVPIFLWSAMPEEQLARRASAVGASGYICKEWGLDAVIARVQSTLETHII